MTIRIGEDGKIIHEDSAVTNSSTVIQEDGTIETISTSNRRSPSFNGFQTNYQTAPPVSPLARGRENTGISNVQTGTGPVNRKTLSELEYDLMVNKSQIKGSLSAKAIVASCLIVIVSILCTVFITPIFLVPLVVPAIMLPVKITKRSKYIAEQKMLEAQIQQLKQR